MRLPSTLIRWRTVAALVAGILAGSVLITPAVGHIASIAHTWNKHFRPLADARYVRKACPGGMVKVGPTCIDRYEVSVWSQPNGGIQYGVSSDNYPCSDNGQNCKGQIFARAVPGVVPSGYITWFQAQAALANVGKRLPTSAEWQMAALGTPDPGGTPSLNDCNTASGDPEFTGTRSNCISHWGAYDMVGNLEEWVADWVPRSTTCGSWPAGYNDDFQCLAGAATIGAPGTLVRGGASNGGPLAGVFNVLGSAPSDSNPTFGFRGAM